MSINGKHLLQSRKAFKNLTNPPKPAKTRPRNLIPFPHLEVPVSTYYFFDPLEALTYARTV